MEPYCFDSPDITVTLNKHGVGQYQKASYPVRYGRYSEIKTPDHIFQFNLNGEIKYLKGLDKNWPHPNEWLKRTVADDWVFYSSGGYNGIYSFIGEYYLPYFSYSGSPVFRDTPFENRSVTSSVQHFNELPGFIQSLPLENYPAPVKKFLNRVLKNDATRLKLNSIKFHKILQGNITVLPPDSRHVDYEVIPVLISDGCLYNCGFCRVKTGQDFTLRSRDNIDQQIKQLKQFYSRDLNNYNSVFLGQHDALHAGIERIEYAALQTYDRFGFDHSHLKGSNLFLFGSPDSLLQADAALFESLNRLPFYTYINIGLESADQATLDMLKKPVSAEMIRQAFLKMQHINKAYNNIEITANFVLGSDLPESHYDSLIDLTGNGLDHVYSKGSIYLSPLYNGSEKKQMQNTFNRLKRLIRLPTYIYLIQRL